MAFSLFLDSETKYCHCLRHFLEDAAISSTTRTPRRIRNRVVVLRDVTRFLKSDWFALSAAKGTTQCIALYQAFSPMRRRGSARQIWLGTGTFPIANFDLCDVLTSYVLYRALWLIVKLQNTSYG